MRRILKENNTTHFEELLEEVPADPRKIEGPRSADGDNQELLIVMNKYYMEYRCVCPVGDMPPTSTNG